MTKAWEAMYYAAKDRAERAERYVEVLKKEIEELEKQLEEVYRNQCGCL